MTATIIRIMKEIAENNLFEHKVGVSICAQPVRPVQRTGQTGLHGLHGAVHVDQPVRPVAKTSPTSLHPEVKF